MDCVFEIARGGMRESGAHRHPRETCPVVGRTMRVCDIKPPVVRGKKCFYLCVDLSAEPSEGKIGAQYSFEESTTLRGRWR